VSAVSIESDIETLVGRDLADPHRLLGAHPHDGGVVVRAFRPAAAKITARPEGGEPVALTQRHPAATKRVAAIIDRMRGEVKDAADGKRVVSPDELPKVTEVRAGRAPNVFYVEGCG